MQVEEEKREWPGSTLGAVGGERYTLYEDMLEYLSL